MKQFGVMGFLRVCSPVSEDRCLTRELGGSTSSHAFVGQVEWREDASTRPTPRVGTDQALDTQIRLASIDPENGLQFAGLHPPEQQNHLAY
jgi:hypothetical protein